MAHVGATTAVVIHSQNLTISASCLPAVLIKVSPGTFVQIASSLFTIVYARDRSRHVYFGRYLDRFVVYTRTATPLPVQVEIEAKKLSKTIGL